MGLPEIKLGLIPGAGGANRLARIAGVEQALELVVGGNPIDASDAKATAIVDVIVDGDLDTAAIDFARSLVAEGRPARPTRARGIPAQLGRAPCREQVCQNVSDTEVAGSSTNNIK